jgi:hypothetical protein
MNIRPRTRGDIVCGNMITLGDNALLYPEQFCL